MPKLVRQSGNRGAAGRGLASAVASAVQALRDGLRGLGAGMGGQAGLRPDLIPIPVRADTAKRRPGQPRR